MHLFLRTSVFLSIAVGFLPGKSECSHNGRLEKSLCEFFFDDVCYDVIPGSKTWLQSRSICEMEGGELLNQMNRPIKDFLESITKDITFRNVTVWLGEGVIGETRERVGDTERSQDSLNADDSPGGLSCTYMKLQPIEVVTAPDCTQKHGFLCTYRKPPTESKQQRTAVVNNNIRTRHTRSVAEMAPLVTDVDALLVVAEKVLRQWELMPGEPTDANRDEFIAKLLEATQGMTPEEAVVKNETVSRIINCSSAILHICLKKCDLETNPNPKALFETVFEIFRTLSMLLGTETLVLQHPTGTIYQSSHAAGDLNNLVLGSMAGGEFIRMPSFSALQPHLSGVTNVVAQMATFNNNPHPSDDNITGTVISLVLNSGTEDIKIENLSEMIEIFLPRPNASARTNETFPLEENKKALTGFNVSDPSMTVFITVEPNANVSFSLTLSYGAAPNETNQFNKTVVSQNEGYRWMITPDMFGGQSGMWYVDAQLFNSTWEPGLRVKIESFMSKCMYWDVTREMWSGDGCHVGELSTPDQTQCLCNHLTLFGSSFFVMPNYVDVSRTAELFATVSKNYVVLALLCAFFGLYLITLMWACYADRRALSKRKMTLLEDNHPAAPYNYLISFQTGQRKSAGTSANVNVKLIGADGESDIQNLSDPDKPVFERGSVDVFVLSTPYPLGEVRHLRLQHDNSGGQPAWYINKVMVQDLHTRQVWQFLCDCWISSDHGDGVTKKTFNAAKNNEIANFRNIFQTRTSSGFRDEHIWVSIVDPPSRSPFTRAQRVSCCMSLLLCTMAINIAFWNIPVNENSPVLFSFGSLRITWQEVMVGVESGLLMFPINILIITIFRSIKPRMIKKKAHKEENMKVQPATIPSILKETEEFISMVSRSQKNRMPPMQSLESSADLCPALERVHALLQYMQGETESNPHWVYCSKFLLASLSHLMICLEKVDAKNFYSPQEYQQTLNLTNTLVRKAEMVYSSHLATCPPPPAPPKKRAASCWLPWWFVFLGWFLLLSISAISTFFTLLYGFEYGKEKSIMWVMSLCLSLFQSIFILQPLKVVGIAVIFALLLKPVRVEESEEVEQVLSEQRETCRRYCGKTL